MTGLAAERERAARASEGKSDEAIYRAVAARLERLPRVGDLLDFGAGTGEVAARALALPTVGRVLAADLVAYDDAARGVEWVLGDLNEPLPLEDGSVDTIVAVEVVEHLENPRAVAREWFRLLRAGGVVIATTPNNESWRALVSLVFRRHFIAFTDAGYPAHITALTATDLRRILGEAGFEAIDVFYTDHGTVPKLTHLTWQRLSRGRLVGVRYSDNVGVTAVKPR